ncbi:hypothetical protein UACE39S_04060 [Ureibacillus acetophenoni]
MIFMDFLIAFVVGGIICLIGQLIMDFGKLTPGHTLSILVVSANTFRTWFISATD